MSPEEAIEVLTALEDWLYFSSMNGGTKIQREAIEIAIAAIKKEEAKMDDSISRQEVLDAIDEISNEVADGYGFDYAKWREYFCELPPAEPKRMRGKWIPITNGRIGHECDQCHEYAPSYESGNEYLSRFCPYCGVKMEET